MSAVLALVDRYGVLALAGLLAYRLLGIATAWQADMSGIYLAAHFFAEGDYALIYPSATELVTNTPVEWQPTLAAMGYGGAPAYPYVYPPIWAAVLAPFAALLGPELFLSLSAIVQFGLFFWSVRLAWDIAGRPMPWSRWALISAMVIASAAATVSALALNQPQITLTFLVLLGIRALGRDQNWRAGSFLAIAAAIKLTPVIFILVPLVLRRWHAVIAMCAVLALLVVANTVIGHGGLNQDFIDRARVLSDYTVSARITYNIAPFLLTLFGDEADIVRTVAAGGFTALDPVWVKLISNLSVIVLAGLLVILTWQRPDRERIATLMLGLALIIALGGPFGWAHYYLVPSLMLPALLGGQIGWLGRITGIAVLIFASSPVIFAPSYILAQTLPLATYVILLIVTVTRKAEVTSARPPLRPAAP